MIQNPVIRRFFCKKPEGVFAEAPWDFLCKSIITNILIIMYYSFTLWDWG